jgi:hypothetical protein
VLVRTAQWIFAANCADHSSLMQHVLMCGRTALRSATPAFGVSRLGVRAGREGYQVAVWVPFVFPPMLILLAVMLQVIETRLLGNGPGRTRSTEQADVVIPPAPTVSSASSASSG